MADPKVIYLAPECCASPDEGRLWCSDDVWPCDDCPHKHEREVCGVRYVLDEKVPMDRGALRQKGV